MNQVSAVAIFGRPVFFFFLNVGTEGLYSVILHFILQHLWLFELFIEVSVSRLKGLGLCLNPTLKSIGLNIILEYSTIESVWRHNKSSF